MTISIAPGEQRELNVQLTRTWTQLFVENWNSQIGISGYSDWRYYGTGWPYYESSIYVSPPSCIAGVQNHNGWTQYATNRNLPQLMLINNIWFGNYSFTERFDWMRGQADPTYPNTGYRYPDDCYLLRFHRTGVNLYRRYGLNSQAIDYAALNLPAETWIKYRWMLYNFPDSIAPTHVAYRFDLWNVDHWDEVFSGIASPCAWWNSSVNQFGFWLPPGNYPAPIMCAIDDTELWIPTVY